MQAELDSDNRCLICNQKEKGGESVCLNKKRD